MKNENRFYIREKKIANYIIECYRSHSQSYSQHSPGHHLTGEGCYMHGSCSGCLLHRSVCRYSSLPTDPSCRSQLQQSQDKTNWPRWNSILPNQITSNVFFDEELQQLQDKLAMMKQHSPKSEIISNVFFDEELQQLQDKQTGQDETAFSQIRNYIKCFLWWGASTVTKQTGQDETAFSQIKNCIKCFLWWGASTVTRQTGQDETAFSQIKNCIKCFLWWGASTVTRQTNWSRWNSILPNQKLYQMFSLMRSFNSHKTNKLVKMKKRSCMSECWDRERSWWQSNNVLTLCARFWWI